MSNFLITGSNGFLGKFLYDKLNLTGCNIFTFGTTNKIDELPNLIKQSDYIFHFAAIHRPKDTNEFYSNNYNLTKRIVDIIKNEKSHKHLIFSSTVQVNDFNIENIYSKSKKDEEDYILLNSAGFASDIYRLPNLFGPGAKVNHTSVVATFSYNIMNNIPITISDPAKSISFSYIGDVIDLMLSNLKNLKKGANIIENINTFPATLGYLVYLLSSIKLNPDLYLSNFKNNSFEMNIFKTYISYKKYQANKDVSN